MHSFQAPSKSFLLGEYLATQGGLAQVAVFQPCFQLHVQSVQDVGSDPGALWSLGEKLFHPASPAGRWISENSDFFQGYRFQFVDPHQGRGGFGASTAQYLLLRQFQHQMVTGNASMEKSDLATIWSDYRRLAWSGRGAVPSGADLVSQACQEICFFRGEDFFLQTFSWPFENLSLSFFATGKKLATHEHLDSLNSFNFQKLKEISDQSYQALRDKNSQKWIQSIQDYRQELKQLGLEASTTTTLLENLPETVLAAKGCGAMGVDILLIVANLADQDAVRNYFENLGLRWIQDSGHLYKAPSRRIG